MKKLIFFLLTAGLAASLLTGCREPNVSDASDGSITSGHTDSVVGELSEMVSEAMTEMPSQSGPAARSRRDAVR